VELISHKQFGGLGEKSLLGRSPDDSWTGKKHPYLNGTWVEDKYDTVYFYKKPGQGGDLIAIWLMGVTDGAIDRQKILAAIGLPQLPKGMPRVVVDALLGFAPEDFDLPYAAASPIQKLERCRSNAPESRSCRASPPPASGAHRASACSTPGAKRPR
jgi:hypothetical protein